MKRVKERNCYTEVIMCGNRNFKMIFIVNLFLCYDFGTVWCPYLTGLMSVIFLSQYIAESSSFIIFENDMQFQHVGRPKYIKGNYFPNVKLVRFSLLYILYFHFLSAHFENISFFFIKNSQVMNTFIPALRTSGRS